ncbi:hypothetical protein OG625_04110 [Streptomyces sp. NBC_01351]|uniref:DUF6777 domain-containing protein n=1 Tax=Streptomyces sp. NBC_01351 TaxID=2903833 RepID=UPI002E3822F8|nr:DUF6777 domain-containing protein [Streptomyces sp. NBC_01351]
MHGPTPPTPTTPPTTLPTTAPTTPRQAPRRHAQAGAALFAALGLFAAGCGGSEETQASAGPESQEVYLQPVASAGPDPFTASSATAESAPVQPPLPNPTGRGIRTVNADTPGLYGGTQRLGSCDVEQQVRYLTEDDGKARAFAQAADVEQAKIPEFLRGLTPVVLRADTRVTNHGFRGGRADGFQSVLQAGTAVLVDEHGMPRVRCGCGNPLGSPRAAKGSPVHKGEPWHGYQPNQVVVIEPTIHVINNLVIVNIADNTWLERKHGDDGAQDRTPQVVPPYDPADGIPAGPSTTPGTTRPGTDPADPCASPVGPDGNSLARTSPPGTPPAAPAPGTTDCPTGPAAPSNPASPQQQPTPLPPPDAPTDIPSDLPPQIPTEPGVPLEPDGSTPGPTDPYDPFTDPNADPPADPYSDPNADPPADPYEDPNLSPPPSDEGYELESA